MLADDNRDRARFHLVRFCGLEGESNQLYQLACCRYIDLSFDYSEGGLFVLFGVGGEGIFI